VTISVTEVEYVARLARLDLSAEEVVTMSGQLDRIMSYIDKLNELDTSGVIPTTHAIPTSNAFRTDTVRASLSLDQALANGPVCSAEAFKVPRVI